MVDVRQVADAIREAEALEVAPRFGKLRAEDIDEKLPGEVVTEADRACEAVLTRSLTGFLDVPVIGEEAVAANPSLLGLLDSQATCWIVDPLDGTAKFAAGSPDYAVMVALMRNGAVTASWIWVPATAEMYIAELGGGATCNDTPLRRQRIAAPIDTLSGVVKERFLPEGVRAPIEHRKHELGGVEPGSNCAGIEYPQLARGDIDFILYWRTLPWDHAPGVLLATEAGCVAVRPDGSNYQPHSSGVGLLVASHGAVAPLSDLFFGVDG